MNDRYRLNTTRCRAAALAMSILAIVGCSDDGSGTPSAAEQPAASAIADSDATSSTTAPASTTTTGVEARPGGDLGVTYQDLVLAWNDQVRRGSPIGEWQVEDGEPADGFDGVQRFNGQTDPLIFALVDERDGGVFRIRSEVPDPTSNPGQLQTAVARLTQMAAVLGYNGFHVSTQVGIDPEAFDPTYEHTMALVSPTGFVGELRIRTEDEGAIETFVAEITAPEQGEDLGYGSIPGPAVDLVSRYEAGRLVELTPPNAASIPLQIPPNADGMIVHLTDLGVGIRIASDGASAVTSIVVDLPLGDQQRPEVIQEAVGAFIGLLRAGGLQNAVDELSGLVPNESSFAGVDNAVQVGNVELAVRAVADRVEFSATATATG